MRTTYCFLIMVLVMIIGVRANTSSADGEFSPSLSNGLDRLIGMKERFHIPVGLRSEEMSADVDVRSMTYPAISPATISAPDTRFSTFDGSGKKKSKICYTHNHCYKKKLVCPKNCKDNDSAGRVVSNHVPGECIFNCKKCIAHC